MHTKKLTFLFLTQNICCGYSKEPSHWDGSSVHPKHMLKLMGKKIVKILNPKILFTLTYVCHRYLHWPKMKTLHFISLNNCFVSIHVVVRFTHAYRDFVADNDDAIFIPIPGLFKRQRLKNVFLTLHVLRNRWFTNSFKTDKKTFAAEYW